jgi:F0F1-type ATP synthase gamma subunit
MTSDKGLCGSSNSGVARFCRNIVQAAEKDSFKILCIGEKGTAALNRMVGPVMYASIHQVI